MITILKKMIDKKPQMNNNYDIRYQLRTLRI